jgi:hypothetical protein
MRIFLTYLLMAFSFHAAAQNYIGMKKTDIIKIMQKDQPQFKLDTSSVNRTYKYIKLVDKISEQTMLFFLDENNTCTYVRWMSDYANLNDIMAELNKKYKKKDKKTWSYVDKAQEFIVTLEEGEWFFTVGIRKK